MWEKRLPKIVICLACEKTGLVTIFYDCGVPCEIRLHMRLKIFLSSVFHMILMCFLAGAGGRGKARSGYRICQD